MNPDALTRRLGPPPVWTAGTRFASIAGVDRIGAFREGTVPLPPAYLLVGMRTTLAEVGRVAYVLDPSRWLEAEPGLVDLAAVAFFADAPAANAVHSVLPAGRTLRTVVLAIEFLGELGTADLPLTADARARGQVEDDGVAVMRLLAADGRLVGSAVTRTLSLDHPAPDLDEPLPARRGPVPPTLSRPVSISRGGRPGRDWLAGVVEGGPPPPFWDLLGIRVSEVGTGRAALEMAADGWLTSPARLLYGGSLTGLATAALEAALWSSDAPTERTRLVDVRYNFTRMVVPDGGPVVGEAHVVHRGRTTAIADVEVRDADGRRVGLGRASAMIRDRKEVS